MRAHPLLTAICFAALTSSLLAQDADPIIERIIDEGQNRNQVMKHLDELVNGVGPRLTSSDACTQAQEWAVERLKGWGLDARLERWGEFPVGFNRGPWFGRVVKPESRPLTFTTLAWTPGTTGKTEGPAMLVPKSLEELEKRKAGMAGHWILEDFPLDRRARNSTARRELRTALDAAYEEVGILGVIRSTGSELVRTSGNYRISWEDRPTLIRINLKGPEFDAIIQDLGAGEVRLEFDIRNHWRKGPIPLYNVIADIKGTEKPDEYVIIGGHIDSWDGATGTTDNGTGVSSTMEAARILGTLGIKPKRTIRFMLWSGEEQGLLGSRAYIRQHQELVDKISGVFVHDGGTNYVSGISVTEQMLPMIEKVFAPATTLSKDMPFEIRTVAGLRAGGGSDHASFLAFGIPGFFWRQSGRTTYGYGWHTQNDTYDLAVPEYQRHTSTIVALCAYGIANLDAMLPRDNVQSTAEAIPSARRLGVNLRNNTLVVSAVTSGRVAEKAGIKPGDQLMEIDGVALDNRFVLRSQLQGGDPEKELTILRDGKKVKLKLTFAR